MGRALLVPLAGLLRRGSYASSARFFPTITGHSHLKTNATAMLYKQPSKYSLEGCLDICRAYPRAAVAVSLVLATAVAIVDFLVGDEVPLIVCYLPSVIITCWVVSLTVGAALAVACCTVWLIDDLIAIEGQGLSAHEFWIAAVHGVFFTVIIGMLLRLRAAHEREQWLARTDGLTGLVNAKAFREHAEQALAKSNRDGAHVTVAFIDCDNFKTVNDTLGHLEGDRLLAAISEQMQQSVRKQDLPARMGGDEFAILLPETTEEEAKQVIERVCVALNARMQESDWPVTFSVGVAIYATPPVSVDALIQGADELMYEVKSKQKAAALFKLVA